MAIAIKSIPVLQNSSAKSFSERADKAMIKPASIDFSKQIKSANKILQKAKMK